MSEKKIKASLATNLRKARRATNLTQQEVAGKAGTDVTYYAKLERGEAIPSLKMLEKVLKVLDLKSDEALPF
ncbi:hypothetical protein BH09PAT4_BH09PAT4_09450 [soil metagenome]